MRVKTLFGNLLVLLALVGTAANAQLLYQEGSHYVPLREPQPTPGSDGVEVLEFFSYGCSHCYEFEEHVGPWAADLDDDVEFRQVPAGLGRGVFQQLAAVFHIAEVLGVRDDIHDDLFAEIHEKHNHEVLTADGLKAFFADHGVDEAAFIEAFNSDEVRSRFAASESAAPRYDLMGVPTMIVNGKYRVVRNEHVRSYDDMLAVVDYLIDLERAAADGGAVTR